MFVLADGRRSAIPADFQKGQVVLLADMAIRSKNPVLRARLADVCWLLDRRQGRLGGVTIGAYIDTIEAVERGELKFPSTNDRLALDYRACELLRRALHIGWTIGWSKPEATRARDAVIRLRERAIELRVALAAVRFAEIDLDFCISDPVTISAGIEKMLAEAPIGDVHLSVSLWRLAARGFHVAKRDDDKHRCQAGAAEVMAAEAERIFAGQGQRQGSAMLASQMMSNAIAQFHGVPATKVRRTELRHRLVDMQSRISEEMSVFSHQWDIAGVEAKVKEALGESSLLDQLFVFAAVEASPEPGALIAEAKESIREHPLSSLFEAVHYDKEGKAVHRSASAGLPSDPSEFCNPPPDRAIRVDPAEFDRRDDRYGPADNYGPAFPGGGYVGVGTPAEPFRAARPCSYFQPGVFAVFSRGPRERLIHPYAAARKLTQTCSENE